MRLACRYSLPEIPPPYLDGGVFPSLGNISEFASIAEIIEDFSSLPTFEGLPEKGWHWRFELARRQRLVINKARAYGFLKRLCRCSRVPIPSSFKTKSGEVVKTGSPGQVEAHWYGQEKKDAISGINHPLGYVWLQKCANPLSCFVCAPKIRLYRGQEVKKACEAMIKKHGWGWFFLTLTAPHDWKTDPVPQTRLFQEAKRLLKTGRWWQDFKARWGIKTFHQIKALEVTDDAPWSENPSGVHVHEHSIDFYEREEGLFSPGEAAIMQAELQAKWVQCLLKVGIKVNNVSAALDIGLKLELPRKPKKHFLESSIQQAADYLSLGAIIEITPGIKTKITHRADRITHWQLMELALTKYPQLQPRMVAILKALKGRHWLHWSPGLKALCGLGEVSDADIMKEKTTISMTGFNAETWGAIDDHKAQSRIMAAVCDDISSSLDLSASPADLADDDEALERYQSVVSESFARMVKVLKAGYDPLTGEVVSQEWEKAG